MCLCVQEPSKIPGWIKVVKNYYPDFIIRNPEVRCLPLIRHVGSPLVFHSKLRLNWLVKSTAPLQVRVVGIQSEVSELQVRICFVLEDSWTLAQLLICLLQAARQWRI